MTSPVVTETDAIVNRLLDNLAATVSSQVGTSGSALRRQIGDVRARFASQILAKTFADELLKCFTLARQANAKLSSLVRVREQLFAENPEYLVNQLFVLAAITFCLTTEAQMLLLIHFVSRDDVDAVMARTKLAFDTARELAADAPDLAIYQALIQLAGNVTRQLATAARPLPRMIDFNLPKNFPALVVSNRVYYDPSRWDELVLENRVPHPAFMPRALRGLSA